MMRIYRNLAKVHRNFPVEFTHFEDRLRLETALSDVRSMLSEEEQSILTQEETLVEEATRALRPRKKELEGKEESEDMVNDAILGPGMVPIC